MSTPSVTPVHQGQVGSEIWERPCLVKCRVGCGYRASQSQGLSNGLILPRAHLTCVCPDLGWCYSGTGRHQAVWGPDQAENCPAEIYELMGREGLIYRK